MSRPELDKRLTDWFRHWRAPLRRFLLFRRGLSAADIDDVAQEVFVRLLRYDRGDLVEHPQAYLFKIASNVAAEWSIRSRSTHPHESKWLGDLPAEERPDNDVDRAAAQAEIMRAINLLPVRHRRVLKLRFAEGMENSQIAEALGVSERIVKRTLAQSYEKLRGTLDTELLGVLVSGHD